MTFRLEDGHTLHLAPSDPQLRHVERCLGDSTAHPFQGPVDTVIAARPPITASRRRKSFMLSTSPARDRTELVTDDRGAEGTARAATGERIAAFEAVEAEREKSARPIGSEPGRR